MITPFAGSEACGMNYEVMLNKDPDEPLTG
jgi:hypothetical protein